MATNEQLRRIVIRVVTSLLNLIIGPAGAWVALGIRGVAGYIVVHTVSRFIIAELASKKENISKRAYRASPILLFLAGIAPLLFDTWECYVILVPFLLASFEGTYWSAFHGFRRSLTSDNERNSVKSFQKYEILSTVLASITVILLTVQDLVEFGGLIGSLLAVLAILIPMSPLPEGASIGFSTSDLSTHRAIFGRLTTGSFGVISYITTWGMRIVSMDTGGIALLGAMVAMSTVVGFIISERNEKLLDAEDADIRNWKVGNYLAMAGTLAMIASLGLNSNTGFLVSYLVCRGGTSGILHHLEVRISGQMLSGEGGVIGLRERVKFGAQTRVLLGYLVISLPILAYLGEVPEIALILFPALVLVLMCCILNLRTVDLLDSHRLV